MRDRALLGVLVTCALRRGELSRMNCEHLAMRDGRWVFLDFKGKGNKTRSVAVPLWVKQEIDGWLDVAGIEKGPIFRRVLANGRVGKDALTERAVWQLVREYAAQVGIGELAPHDLRRYAESRITKRGHAKILDCAETRHNESHGVGRTSVVFHRVAGPHCWGPALSEPDVTVSCGWRIVTGGRSYR